MIFAFVAFAVDTGRISVTRASMQNAVDAAALAASQEITLAVRDAGRGGQDATIDANSLAVERARAMAVKVAAANGVYLDGERDVQFGKRQYDPQTGEWPISWATVPYNTVRVTARKSNPDPDAADARLPMSFGWAVGLDDVEIITSASAFIEARDLVLVWTGQRR